MTVKCCRHMLQMSRPSDNHHPRYGRYKTDVEQDPREQFHASFVVTHVKPPSIGIRVFAFLVLSYRIASIRKPVRGTC
jgi:hypothetical protein